TEWPMLCRGPMTVWVPTNGPASGQPVGGQVTTSSAYASRKASMSRAFHASIPARTTSMFSRDNALLRQPHGFEGLLLIVVVRAFFDLARPQRADQGIAPGKLDAAYFALGVHQEEAD